MKDLRSLLLLLMLICLSWTGIAQDKIAITKADDLPRRSVTLKGTATEIAADLPQLHELADGYIKNLEADLDKYDIHDKATLKDYYFTLVACYAFKKDLDKAEELLLKAQELEDKESEKLTTGLFLKAFAKAYRQTTDTNSEEFRGLFVEAYAQLWRSLPYEKVKNEVESMRGSLSIFNPSLITSSLESQLQPFLDNNRNTVPEGIIGTFLSIRISLDYRAGLVPEMLKVLNELYENNQSREVKKDIWSARAVSLSASDKGSPVVIAIWDSGTDVSIFPEASLHRDKDGKNGIGYSLIDYQKDDLLLEDPKGKIRSDLKRLQSLTKGFMDLQAAIESPEVMEIRQTIAALQPEQVKDFQEELSFYGNYAHGTHVAGIAMKDNPFARLLVARMGFDYRTLPPAHTMANAEFQAKMYGDVVRYFRENEVRVVNMSWRYGVAAYEGLLSLNGIGENEEERKKMAREMFEIEKKALHDAIKSAPEILFICGSGNENNDAGFVEYIPASLSDLPNLITIGAVDNEGKKTSFTTEGKNVRLYANGFEVESYVPGGEKVKFSGTSMASPNVANLAAKILALQPELSPTEVIALIEEGADSLPENPGLLLINPRRTLELATGEKRENVSTSQLLTGQWKPDPQTAAFMVEDYLEQVKQQSAEQAQALESQKAMLEQVFAQIVIEYKADGTVEIAVPSAPKQTGTWTLTDNNTRISMKISGQADFEIIREISDTELKTTTSKGKGYVYLAL
jgi:subtilisin family serine protease